MNFVPQKFLGDSPTPPFLLYYFRVWFGRSSRKKRGKWSKMPRNPKKLGVLYIVVERVKILTYI
nr:MAG TPA: hypothetical protein [Caudoviricetes sp.]